MKTTRFHNGLMASVLVAFAASLLIVGIASAKGTWADQLWTAANYYKFLARTTHTATYMDPYLEKIAKVRQGVDREDRMLVRTQMGEFFTMLRTRAHNIPTPVANQLYDLAIQLTPLEEFGVSIPEFPAATMGDCAVGKGLVNGEQFAHYERWC